MTVATHMLPEDLQRSNEYRFARKHINTYITQAIEQNPDWMAMITDGTDRVQTWLDHWTAPFTNQCGSQKHHASKSARLNQLKHFDVHQLVFKLIVGTAYFQRPETFVTASALLASQLDFDDRRDAILTVAELCAVLCWTGAFTLWKDEPESSMMLRSELRFPTELTDAINRSMYLPPLVCQPKPVTSNYESPYLTFNDCRILGKKNGHNGDICLDVLNTQMQVPLQLAKDFLAAVEEPEPKDWDTIEQKQTWDQFKYDSYCLYSLITKQGNRFWLDQKVDKRGRIYAQGFHITTQGSAFKKALIEFAREEVVDGVPEKFQKSS